MSAAREMLGAYQHVLSELKFVMGSKGVFDITVNDQLIYSKAETGRHIDEGEALELLSAIVGPEVARYGT